MAQFLIDEALDGSFFGDLEKLINSQIGQVLIQIASDLLSAKLTLPPE